MIPYPHLTIDQVQCLMLFVVEQGAVVNVSSVAATIPFLTMAPYCAAKAAQDAMTRNLALEFARKGVRINSVLPGEFLSAVLYFPFAGMRDVCGLSGKSDAAIDVVGIAVALGWDCCWNFLHAVFLPMNTFAP